MMNTILSFGGKSRGKTKAISEDYTPYIPDQRAYDFQPQPMCIPYRIPAPVLIQAPYPHHQPPYQHQQHHHQHIHSHLQQHHHSHQLPIQPVPCIHHCNSQHLIQAPQSLHQNQSGPRAQHHLQRCQMYNEEQMFTINQQQHEQTMNQQQAQYQNQSQVRNQIMYAQQCHHDQQQPQQYQVYQNNQSNSNIMNKSFNSDKDLPLESRCMLHETNDKELVKVASSLKDELNKLAEELKVIHMKIPQYKVIEVRI